MKKPEYLERDEHEKLMQTVDAAVSRANREGLWVYVGRNTKAG